MKGLSCRSYALNSQPMCGGVAHIISDCRIRQTVVKLQGSSAALFMGGLHGKLCMCESCILSIGYESNANRLMFANQLITFIISNMSDNIPQANAPGHFFE